MVVLNFFRIPVLLALFGIVFSLSSFANDEFKEVKLSARMVLLAKETKGLEKKLEELEQQKMVLLDTIKEHENFLDFAFSLTSNRNGRDLELIQAEYRFKNNQITQIQLNAVRNAVSVPMVLDALPTGLVPIRAGTAFSPGVPAVATSTSVSVLAAKADAVLVPDPVNSTPHRGMTSGMISASTIATNPTDVNALSIGLERVLLEDDRGKIVKKLFQDQKQVKSSKIYHNDKSTDSDDNISDLDDDDLLD
jgi:hypothetical protein